MQQKSKFQGQPSAQNLSNQKSNLSDANVYSSYNSGNTQLLNQNLDIELELYNRILKMGLLKANQNVKILHDKQKVILDKDSVALFENGIILGKYMSFMKDILRQGNQDINFDQQKIAQLKNLNTPQAKLFNWNIICTELDKIGISIEGDDRSLIIAGDLEQMKKVMQRIERFIGKISGKKINFDLLRAETIQSNLSFPESDKAGGNRRGNKQTTQKKMVKDGVDILTMNTERPPADTESSLELLLNTLCRAFQMKPKQAAALLTNNNQFLVHAIVKGVKGKYEPVIAWYQDLYSNSKHLTTLLELEMEQFPNNNNFLKVLQTLSCGLYSHNLDIARWCMKLLTKAGYDFSFIKAEYDLAVQWFQDKEGGLELGLHCLKKFTELQIEFCQFVLQFTTLQHQYEIVFKTQLKKHFTAPIEYVTILNDLFPYITAGEGYNKLKEAGVIDYWLENSIRQADNDGKHSYDERIVALSLITEIWLTYTDHVDKRQDDTINQIFSVYKRASREKHMPIKIISITLLFKLLDHFSQNKNPSAPGLYRILIFSFIENPFDVQVRNLYLINFIEIFNQVKNIPIGLLVDPLVRQIQISENQSFNYKTFDFDFFVCVADHQKLQLGNAIPLIDLLAKVYLNEVVMSSAAKVPFVMLCNRYLTEEAMQDFLSKFVTICLSILMNLEKNAEELQQRHKEFLIQQEAQLALVAQGKAKSKILALQAPPIPKKNTSTTRKMTKEQRLQKQKEQDEELTRRIKKSNIIEILLKLQNLRNEDLNEMMREMLLTSNKRFSELYGYYNKGIMELLRWWGDSEQIMFQYVKAIQDRIQREKEEEERRIRMEEERKRREEEERKRKEEEEKRQRQIEMQQKLEDLIEKGEEVDPEERRLLKNEYKQIYGSDDDFINSARFRSENSQAMGSDMRSSMQLVPYQGTDALKNLKNYKAIQQIEKIKKTKQDREEQKRLEAERKKLVSARKKKKLQELLQKRKLELGIAPKPTPNYYTGKAQKDSFPMLVYEEGDDDEHQKQQRSLAKKFQMNQIELLDLTAEEERDQEAVIYFMKKYAKLWKNLFYKYANSGYSSKQIYNFDQLQEKLQTINMAEMTKVLREHGMITKYLNKDELQTILKLINTKIYKRSDLQNLEYQGFLQAVQQIAFFSFSRPPKDLSHMPPVESIRFMVEVFEQATRQRGMSTVLYDDPDITSIGDRQLIHALNNKLQEDPSYPIPEGYTKIVEKTPVYDYRIPETIAEQMPEANLVSIELFDEIINEIMGFHVLEPLVSFEEKLKVRPLIKNTFKEHANRAEALNYMKKVEKKIKPIDQSQNDYARMSAGQKRQQNLEVKPQLNVNLKVEVATYPLKERPFVYEVAEVLEEILQATEKGLDHLPSRLNRAPGQRWNQAKQLKLENKEHETEERRMKNDKRLKRDAALKEEIRRINEQKEQELEEKKKEREEQRKREIEDKKQRQVRFQRKIEQKKQAMKEERDKKIEEIQKKKQQDEENNKEANERKKQERREFMRKQKEKLEKEFEEVYKEREALQEQEVELKKKEKEFQDKIRSQMETYIKEHHDDRQKEQAKRDQINGMLNSLDFQNVFSLYDKSLQYVFKFYASQDKKDVNFNLDKYMNTMNFREFIRFGFQQNIVPALMPPERLVTIFRQLMREKMDQKKLEIQSKGEEYYVGDDEQAQIMDYEDFKKALVRIAITAQDELGGQREDLLIQKLEEETKKKDDENRKKQLMKQREQDKLEYERQLKEQLRQEYEQKQQQIKNITSKSPQKDLGDEQDSLGKTGKKRRVKKTQEEIDNELEISVQKKKNEDAFFDKWMKQRQAQGIDLKKRIIGADKGASKKVTKKKKVKKTTKEGEEGEDQDESQQNKGQDDKKQTKKLEHELVDVREGEDIDDQDNEQNQDGEEHKYNSTISRKTKASKAIRDLQEKSHHADLLRDTVKIQDIKVQQENEPSVVSAKTIEALLIFLGIEPDDNRAVLDKKFNQVRIEIQGQKPNKIKKSQKPNKLESIKEKVPTENIEQFQEEKKEEQEEQKENEIQEKGEEEEQKKEEAEKQE